MSLAVGLIGWPVAHSLSPVLHAAAGQDVGIKVDYRLLPIAEGNLSTWIPRLTRLAGFNVTAPHKSAIRPFLAQQTPAAHAVGAVNTVAVKDGELIGHNTDVAGFSAMLDRPPTRVAVIGAGGAARAVTYALVAAGASLIEIYNRTEPHALALAHAVGGTVTHVRSWSDRGSMRDVDLLVNCLPVAALDQVRALPLSAVNRYIDLGYSLNTQAWIAELRAQGLDARGGLEMLLMQGLAAFQWWTGRSPAVEPIRAALKAVSALH